MYHELVYTSKAEPELDPEIDIKEIIDQSAVNNHLLDVTGILVFDSVNFMQLLEGPADAVEYTFYQIAQDLRHTQVVVQSRAPVESRKFDNQPLKYCDHLTGEIEFLPPGALTDEEQVFNRMMARAAMLCCHHA